VTCDQLVATMSTCRLSSDSVRNSVGASISIFLQGVLYPIVLSNKASVMTVTGFMTQVVVASGDYVGRWHVGQGFSMKPWTWAVISHVGETLVISLTLDNGDDVELNFVKDPGNQIEDIYVTERDNRATIAVGIPIAPVMFKIKALPIVIHDFVVALGRFDVLNSLGAGRACRLFGREWDGSQVVTPDIGGAGLLKGVVCGVRAIIVVQDDGTTGAWFATASFTNTVVGYATLTQRGNDINMRIVCDAQPVVDVLFRERAVLDPPWRDRLVLEA